MMKTNYLSTAELLRKKDLDHLEIHFNQVLESLKIGLHFCFANRQMYVARNVSKFHISPPVNPPPSQPDYIIHTEDDLNEAIQAARAAERDFAKALVGLRKTIRLFEKSFK